MIQFQHIFGCHGVTIPLPGRRQLELWFCPRGTVIPMHRHSRIQSLLVFLGGRMKWTLNAQSKTFGWLDIGRMFPVGPDDAHGAVTTGRFGLFANWESWTGEKSSAAHDLQLVMNDLESLIEQASGNNPEAKAFLYAWHRYCHLIDDVVDGDEPPVRAAQIGRWANDLYSSPFYQRFGLVLGPQVQLITCHFEDSVEMENSKEKWKREVADVIRSNGSDMVRLVAFLVGGYSLMRQISVPLRALCWQEHHTIEGSPK